MLVILTIFQLIFTKVILAVIAEKSSCKYELPSIKFDDMLTLDTTSAVHAAHTLITLGAIQITDIPQFASARYDALGSLAECLREKEISSDENIASSRMNDGRIRRTIASLRFKGTLMPMSSISCGASSAKLRAIVDSTVKHFFRLLDLAPHRPQTNITTTKPLMPPSFHKFEELALHGEHLEHLHAFYDEQSNDILSASTLPLHTDSGLFVAMTAGLVKSKSSVDKDFANGLQIQLPSGIVCKVKTKQESLIVLAGEGASHWISSDVLGAAIRPVPHSLTFNDGIMTEKKSLTRAWYGMMVLPPAEAYLPPMGDHQERYRYSEYRIKELEAVKLATNTLISNDTDEFSISSFVQKDISPACGFRNPKFATGRDLKIKRMLTNTLCSRSDGSNGVMCWTICQSVDDLPCGDNAVCKDIATNEEVDGGHCASIWGNAACQLTCPTKPSSSISDANPSSSPKNSPVDSDSNFFCRGGGYDMYMGGFISSIFSQGQSLDCLLLFFDGWKLDSGFKFTIACIAVFSLGIVIEFCTKLRRNLFRKRWSSQSDASLILLHGLQVLLAYLLMLAAMTYSIEIFLMVVCGLTAGYALFNLHSPPPANLEPCCLDADDKSDDFDYYSNSDGQSVMMTMHGGSDCLVDGYQKIT